MSNPSHHVRQKQKAGIQFVSITYNRNEYINYWLICEIYSDAEHEKSLDCHPRQFSLKVSKKIHELSLIFQNGNNM